MSSLNSLFLNGQVQSTGSTTTTTSSTSTTSSSSSSSSSSTSSTVANVNISPVGSSIDPTLYTYDGQTTLLINSTINQTNNSVNLQYYDPVSGYPNLGGGYYPNPLAGSSGFGNWNFDMTAQNYLNGCISGSNVLDEQTYLYNNLQTPAQTANYLGLYSLDIANGNQQSSSNGDGANTMFFSLTSQPYLSYGGSMYNQPGSMGVPTANNLTPGYSSIGSDSFLFTSQYWVPTNNEILIVQMVFNIANSYSTYYSPNASLNVSTTPAPIINVTVYNKVISREILASVGTGNSCPKPKVYSTGVISLQYLQPGQTFNSGTPCQFLFNNVPVIIADGFTKKWCTMGLVYVPPYYDTLNAPTYSQCQFLTATATGSNTGGDGFQIKGFMPACDITNVNSSPFGATTTGLAYLPDTCSYGHFVVTVAYSYNASYYNPGTNFSAEVLVKNIWRSPIAIYNAYSAYSVNDLINKQVVVLFGKNSNGGTFLITNTGTPLSQVTNYGVTSLGNFMTIMKIILYLYNNTYSLADYFVNTTLINNINSTLGINVQALLLQPVLEGCIFNPSSVSSCPNMWYMFLNSKNSANLSMDVTAQNVFNQTASTYFGMSDSTLADAGVVKYFNSELNMLGTGSSSTPMSFYFGNSLYIGLNVINGQTYYMLVILPEALFNGSPINSSSNTVSIYATPNSIFYFNFNSVSSSQFTPETNTVSTTTGSTSSSTGSTTNSYNIGKVILSASNIPLI